MYVELTRDSVAMGDDVDAPHALRLDLPDGATVGDAVDSALARSYLASIQGGRATWLAVADRSVRAVVAQQWVTPRWLTDPGETAPATIHFRYLAQRDPDEVHAEYA